MPVGAGTGLRVAPPPPVIAPGDIRSNPVESSSQAYARARNEMKFSIPFKSGAPAENRATDLRRLDLAAPHSVVQWEGMKENNDRAFTRLEVLDRIIWITFNMTF